MLNFDDLHSLSVLVDLGEREQAKKLASRMLANAETSELWTIARAAAILDSSNPYIVQYKLSAFGDSLTDEHRRELVTFCAVHTGERPRRTVTDAAYPLFGLSVYYDTRPGYDQHDAQPAGLTVYPMPWETRQARTMTELTRQLRDDARQLPREVRANVRVVDTDTRAAARRAPRSRAEQRAARMTDDYARTRLGVEDRTAPGMRTIFDVDDDTPAPVERPDGYTLDYDRAARTPLRVTPCVSCFIERRPQDAPRNRHDDGLCGDCRTDQRPGLPTSAPRTARPARTVAYLSPAARAHAARAAAITAPCAAVAAHLPRAAALVWIRAYYALSNAEERATIGQFVAAWLDTDQPQPPTTPAPAAPIRPAPALAAA